MEIIRAYKVELRPNATELRKLVQFVGTARFVYNWALRRRMDEYEEWKRCEETGEPLPEKKSSSYPDQNRQLNALKKTEFPWMYELSKCVPQEALRNLDTAYKRFFKGQGKFPCFKKRKSGSGSFRLTGQLGIVANRAKLPRLGRIRMKEVPAIPESARILSCTVSQHAYRWFVSFQVEEDIEVPEIQGPSIGVDLGIKMLATLSDGTEYENPKALRRSQKKLKRLQQALSRSQKGSKRRQVKKRKLAAAHFKVACQRKDAIHKMTTEIAKNYGSIGIEDLNVSGMVKNHRLARAVSDASFGEIRRQLEYKALWYGAEVVVHDRFFPSSKTCSSCGVVKEKLTLDERTFTCEDCGFQCDRDLNAAMNLQPGVPRLLDVDGKALAAAS